LGEGVAVFLFPAVNDSRVFAPQGDGFKAGGSPVFVHCQEAEMRDLIAQ